MIKIDAVITKPLSEEADKAERKRKNFNIHKTYSDPLQRLLNAMKPGTYVQPHKHESPDKRELFIILKGKAAVIEFDNSGNITDHIVLDRNNEVFGVEITEKTFHTIISLEPGTILFEVKDGPYSPLDDKDWAPWAPKEGSNNCDEYLQKILKQLKL